VDRDLERQSDEIARMYRLTGEIDKAQRLLELKVNTLATKIGLYASLGAFVGGGIMSLVVGLFLRR
jgi:hypothetical protein